MEASYFFVAHFLLCYVIPLLIIVVSYAFVGRCIWTRKIPSFQLSDEVQARVCQLQQSKYRALVVIAVVVAAFAVTWFPFYITFTRIQMSNAFDEWKISEELENIIFPVAIPIAQWMSSANSCINPFIYHFLDPRFRNRFHQLFSGQHHK
jgi:hypothetical protein